MNEIIRKKTSQRMSHAVIHNGVAYFCGQVARELVPDVQFIILPKSWALF